MKLDFLNREIARPTGRIPRESELISIGNSGFWESEAGKLVTQVHRVDREAGDRPEASNMPIF